MPRRRTIEVSIINIVLHPHSEELYRRLFKIAKDSKIQGEINKNKRARVGFLDPFTDINGRNCLYGELFLYMALNPNAPWLDDTSDKEADAIRVNELKSRIKGLHPEFHHMRFIMDLNRHKLIFEVRDEFGHYLSPNTMQKALSSIFGSPLITRELGEVKTTVVPAADALDKILAIEQLKKLEIDITPPNPDDWEDEAEEIEAWLDSMGAKRYEQTLTKSPDAETLVPDERTLKLARVAQVNGIVTGSGRTNGKVVVESTKSHPRIERYMLEHKQPILQALKSFAEKLKF